MGRCDHIERVLADTDLFLMSSDYEGMPNALMEAMTVGVPCISSDCRTGPKDLIIPGETGMLFETGDQDGLRDAVRLLIEDPHLAEQLGTNARTEMVSTFTLEKTYSAFMEMCSSII
jgi:glycosyltransferase involved in cell wall biosynthesis